MDVCCDINQICLEDGNALRYPVISIEEGFKYHFIGVFPNIWGIPDDKRVNLQYEACEISKILVNDFIQKRGDRIFDVFSWSSQRRLHAKLK